ncbi:MAG: FliA/WhiG family RNA polymerase sigma factor [Phycisphaeraceae bacterium]|nr:FliA/WhiG family RNA polymerase sigma factor [Phycisphaeraceae bacterium]
MPLVTYHAQRVSLKTHKRTNADELITAGVFGLMDALDAYDFDRGIKFETFSSHRIRGAMLDELRSQDWLPRLIRTRNTRLEQAKSSWLGQRGYAPNDDDLCQTMNVDRKEYRKITRDASLACIVSLQQQITDNNESSDREFCASHTMADNSYSQPSVIAQKLELRDLILEDLTRIERLIVLLYYYEGMTMKEISMTFDISESRVCQMHTMIMAKLRSQLRRHELTTTAALA